jgi:hypothetical protein
MVVAHLHALSLRIRAKWLYCTVQYSMALFICNSEDLATQGGAKNGSHKMLLVQEIQAADCMKYFCLHSRRRTGEMSA